MNVFLGGKVDALFKVAVGRGRMTSLNSFALPPQWIAEMHELIEGMDYIVSDQVVHDATSRYIA